MLYKSALIGLGNIAWKLGKDQSGDSLSHAAAFQTNPQTILSCVSSPDLNEFQQFRKQYECNFYQDIESMLVEEKPDIVSICSPDEYHFEHVLQCIDNQIKMIWLEKPPVGSVVEIDHLLQRIRTMADAPTIVVNYQRRFVESYNNLRKIVSNKTFGEMRLIDINYSRGLKTNGSHMLDILFFITDDADYELVWAERDNDQNNPDAVMRLTTGANVHIKGLDLEYHNIDIVVTFEHARVSILHGSMTLQVETQVEHELFPGYFRLKNSDQSILGKPGFAGSFDAALDNLIMSYETKSPSLSSLSSSAKSMHLMDAILSS